MLRPLNEEPCEPDLLRVGKAVPWLEGRLDEAEPDDPEEWLPDDLDPDEPAEVDELLPLAPLEDPDWPLEACELLEWLPEDAEPEGEALEPLDLLLEAEELFLLLDMVNRRLH